MFFVPTTSLNASSLCAMPRARAIMVRGPSSATGFVDGLTSHRHPQGPRRLMKVNEVAGSNFHAVQLLVHLTGQEFQTHVGMVGREVIHLGPLVPDVEPRVPLGTLGKQLGIHRHAAFCGTSVRNPACRRISWISSSENSASCRKPTLIAGMRFSGDASSVPIAFTSPPSLILNLLLASVTKRMAAAICIKTRGFFCASFLI